MNIEEGLKLRDGTPLIYCEYGVNRVCMLRILDNRRIFKAVHKLEDRYSTWEIINWRYYSVTSIEKYMLELFTS